MKKVISLFLALLMAFSVVTVAFATEGEPTTDSSTGDVTTDVNDGAGSGDSEATPEEDEFGDLQWIMDLPFWTVGPAFKFAKIAFKLVSVYLKVAKIFGLVDKDMGDMLMEVILGLIENGGAQAPADPEAPSEEATTVPEDTTGALAA